MTDPGHSLEALAKPFAKRRARNSFGFWASALATSAFCVCGSASEAHATLSVLAVDTSTGEMGAIVVSCVGDSFDLAEVVAIDVAAGGVVAQSYFFEAGRDALLTQLRSGSTPGAAIAHVANEEFDPVGVETGHVYRQYAALDIDGGVATYTGQNALPFARSTTAEIGSFKLALQGNLMAKDGLLEILKEGFVTAEGSLGYRLAGSMEALGNGGSGDARCAPLTADSGHFELHSPNLEEPLTVTVTSPEAEVALVLSSAVRTRLDEHLPSGQAVSDPGQRGDSKAPRSGCAFGRSTSPGKALWIVFGLLVVLPGLGRRVARVALPRS